MGLLLKYYELIEWHYNYDSNMHQEITEENHRINYSVMSVTCGCDLFRKKKKQRLWKNRITQLHTQGYYNIQHYNPKVNIEFKKSSQINYIL